METTSVKSTLYSFVTLRAPELIKDEQKDFFIFHPNISNSVLYATTHESFKTKLAAFSPSILSEIKTEFNTLYKFGQEVISSRENLSLEKFSSLKTAMSVTPLTDINSLWNNFIYQIFTNSSDACREALNIIIYANYLASKNVIVISASDFKRVLQARTVIPEVFLYNKPLDETPDSSSQNFVAKNQFIKAVETVNTEETIKKLQTFYLEISKAENAYQKKENRKLEEADKRFDVDIQTYFVNKDDVREDERVKYDSQLPQIEYEETPEIDTEIISTFLSDDSKKIFENFSELAFKTFTEYKNEIQQQIEQKSQQIIEEKNLNNEYINLNGIVLPKQNAKESAIAFSYKFCSYLIKEGSKYFIEMYVALPANEVIQTINYSILQTNKPNIDFTDATIYPVSSGITRLKLFPDGIATPTQITNLSLKFTFTFTSGKKYYLQQPFTIPQCVSGVLAELIDIPESQQQKLYGVRRLGIADYRRVEQFVCCYVPGEVSSIENIMAKEYKDRKTTRLRRTENTITNETETETESLTDTTSTDRFEMHKEISSILNDANNFNINAGINWTGGMTSGNVNTGFATSTSKEESNQMAIAQAKEVTQRAEQKITTRVREERVSKIIEEYTEEDVHGFDNRQGNNHISGVYRWIDKIYKNEIHNYGKRLMYEFMIPEPAKFHLIALQNNVKTPTLVEPLDPRTLGGILGIPDFSNVNEYNYKTLASNYGAVVKNPLPQNIIITHSVDFSGGKTSHGGSRNDIKIPDDYLVNIVYLNYTYSHAGNAGGYISIGNKSYVIYRGEMSISRKILDLAGVQDTIPCSFTGWDVGNVVVNAKIECTIKPISIDNWKKETFNTIMDAYYSKLKEYNQAVEDANAQEKQAKESNPLFYRDIEQMVLRKNCIAYMLPEAKIGKDFQLPLFAKTLKNHKIDQNIELEPYASTITFIEQAFEWEIISYQFYPFYWANRDNWKELYEPKSDDKLFAKFLQSGMARVIVTVRPGFEDAVNWFIATGSPWFGSTAPVINDPLYLSIVEELQNPESVLEKTWESRVPSTLTIIQSGSIGLVGDGLPCMTECSGTNKWGISQKDDLLPGLIVKHD